MDAVLSRIPVSMIKSELVQRIAEHNPHLYQRDVENIVNAIARQVEQAGVAQAVDRLGLNGMLALWDPAGGN